MKAADVFTPGRHPTLTYVDDHIGKEKGQLFDALEAGATLVSIAGPSKSGKTVFVENCIGKDGLVHVTGAGIASASELWLRVFDVIGTSIARTTSTVSSKTGSVSAEGGIEGSIPLLAKGKAGVSVASSNTASTAISGTVAIDHLQLLIKELGGSGLVVFIDDFHYVPRPIQEEVARHIKEAIRKDVKIICASVPYHSDDVIRGNPDLRGRVSSIDFDYWKTEVLEKIAEKGFGLLNIRYELSLVRRLAAEAAGSPQLMQALCLNSCFEIGVREAAPKLVDLRDVSVAFEGICRRTVLSAEYGSVVARMKEGPKTRGSDRKMYESVFGWQGDVYRLLAKALSLDPPQLTFRYNNLMERIGQTCKGSGPVGSSVVSACHHAASIVNDSVGNKIVEWDLENDVFDIRDPYLLFYLRWADESD